MNRSPVCGSLCPLIIGCALLALGCRTEIPVNFEENLVHAKKWELQAGLSMDQTVTDTRWALEEMFGTPDEPKLPELFENNEDYASLISPAHLQVASGPGTEQGRGLYRQHCARCHGISGNGRGETAALVDPYPRDYRPGIYKYKSTRRGSKPLKEDLARVIKHGIPGSSMVPDYQLSADEIGPLPDAAVASLVDYVIYLSIRGEVERTMYDEAALELDLDNGERLVDPTLAQTDPEAFAEQWELIEEVVADVADSWIDAEDQRVEVAIPDDMPIPSSREELTTMLNGDSGDDLRRSIQRGHELFVGAVASCSKCHGPDGRGDGQEADYDDWTKDWTIRAGLKPEDEASLIPLIARGALPPRTIKPRNFEEGVFRGGSLPEDLYRRLNQGIAGTPMPAVTLVPGQLEEEDIWHLINYCRSLEKPDPVAAVDVRQAAQPDAAASQTRFVPIEDED